MIWYIKQLCLFQEFYSISLLNLHKKVKSVSISFETTTELHISRQPSKHFQNYLFHFQVRNFYTCRSLLQWQKQQWPLFKCVLCTWLQWMIVWRMAILHLKLCSAIIIFIWLYNFMGFKPIEFFCRVSEESEKRMHFGESFIISMAINSFATFIQAYNCYCVLFSHIVSSFVRIAIWWSIRLNRTGFFYKIYHCHVVFFVHTHPVCTLWYQSTKPDSILQAFISYGNTRWHKQSTNDYCTA